MNSEKRLNHIFQKYPDLMFSLTNTLTKKHPKTSANKIEKLLKRSVERRSKLSARKLSKRTIRDLSTKLTNAIISEIFTCTACLRNFNAPVTLECGHTFCRNCLLVKTSTTVTSCPDCGKTSPDDGMKSNVLIQGIISRLMDCNTIPSNDYHCYHLRCRNIIQNTVQLVNPNESIEKSTIENNTSSRLTLTTSLSRTQVLTPADLECVLCSRCLFEPVTTACGHTFCRGCLARVLDYGLACPLCMAPLAVTDQARQVTVVIEDAIRRLLPGEHLDRLHLQKMEIATVETDTQVPVFICTSAFPGVACPLYVYEPRYRLLTRRCLQTNRRRFAMAAAAPTNEGNSDKFASYGTLLEVRDAVHLHDGRSILTTVGLRRFRVITRGEKDGYDTASVEYIRDDTVQPQQLHTLSVLHERVHRKAARWVHSLAPHVQAEIEQSLGLMPAVESNWMSLPDGPSWAWWLMPVLPLSSQLQLGFLSTLSLEKRLRAIDKMLERMSVRTRALNSNEVSCRGDEVNDSCAGRAVNTVDRSGVDMDY